MTTTGTKRRAAIEKRQRAVTLVTGGTGFLGSHLVRQLIEEGAKDVRVMATSIPDWLVDLGVETFAGSITNTERYYFTPGNLRFPVFQVDELTVGVNICYDRHFPELARVMALKGAHLLVYPTASKADVGRANTWVPEMISRAAENVFYVLGVNRCGVEGPYRYFGHSILVNPYGQEIAALKEDEGLVLGEVRTDEVDRARYDYAHLRDLRLDVYQELARLMYAEPRP